MIGDIITGIFGDSLGTLLGEVFLKIYQSILKIIKPIKYKKTLLSFLAIVNALLASYLFHKLGWSGTLISLGVVAGISLLFGAGVSLSYRKENWLNYVINYALVILMISGVALLLGSAIKLLR